MSGTQNMVVDALNRRSHLLTVIKSEIIDFDSIKELYPNEYYFGDIWEKCNSNKFQEGFLCIPKTSFKKYLSREHHAR